MLEHIQNSLGGGITKMIWLLISFSNSIFTGQILSFLKALAQNVTSPLYSIFWHSPLYWKDSHMQMVVFHQLDCKFLKVGIEICNIFGSHIKNLAPNFTHRDKYMFIYSKYFSLELGENIQILFWLLCYYSPIIWRSF